MGNHTNVVRNVEYWERSAITTLWFVWPPPRPGALGCPFFWGSPLGSPDLEFQCKVNAVFALKVTGPRSARAEEQAVYVAQDAFSYVCCCGFFSLGHDEQRLTSGSPNNDKRGRFSLCQYKAHRVMNAKGSKDQQRFLFISFQIARALASLVFSPMSERDARE